MWLTLLSGKKKGNEFHGIMGGESYDWLTSKIGINEGFYRRAVELIPFSGGMRVLDLGCGTGSFGVAISEKVGESGRIDCVDISEEQLAYAEEKTKDIETRFGFFRCSMDETPFEFMYSAISTTFPFG